MMTPEERADRAGMKIINSTKPNGARSTKPEPSRDDLLVSAWRKRDIPPRDFLLGGVFCTTSRWIIYGDTGVGKTLLALDLAGAMAAMAKFLDWEGTRKIRIMVIDGEMPAETFKERMTLIGDLYGNDIAVYGYNRDDLISTNKGVDVMHPLDTELGQRWLVSASIAHPRRRFVSAQLRGSAEFVEGELRVSDREGDNRRRPDRQDRPRVETPRLGTHDLAQDLQRHSFKNSIGRGPQRLSKVTSPGCR